MTGNSHELNYGGFITESALAHAGIALKSRWDIHPLLAEGSLRPVLENFKIELEWGSWGVRPPGQMVPARTHAFIDFMATTFRELEA